VDALGNPLLFKLSAGNVHDSKPAASLIKPFEDKAKAILADKAYDSNAIVEQALLASMAVIIPTKANRIVKRDVDFSRYKARHLVENLFQRMKIFRRIASRFDKLDINFMGFIHLAGIFKWIH
jgi:transposase